MATTKQRQSNIELLRLAAMFLIIFTHTNFFSLGRPKMDAFHTEPVWTSIRFAEQSLTYIGVNLFILISGYFSIKAHLRSVAAFLFQILFFSLGVLGILYFVGLSMGEPLVTWENVGDAFMILTRYNWFIPSYLLLMLFAPMLNSFCENSGRARLGLFILLLFAASSYLGWGTHYCKEFNDGYSFVSLILLYVIGRYLRLHRGWLTNRSWKTDVLHFLLYVLLNTVIALWRIKNPYRMSLYALNNPVQLYGAVCFFLFFTKIHFQNTTVNTLAKGTFGIFLLQMHPQIIPHFRKTVQYMYAHLSHTCFSVAVFLLVLAFCVLGILMDMPRLWLWKKWGTAVSTVADKVENRILRKGFS